MPEAETKVTTPGSIQSSSETASTVFELMTGSRSLETWAEEEEEEALLEVESCDSDEDLESNVSADIM